jgi:beta-barrel assembly-enhancing protease
MSHPGFAEFLLVCMATLKEIDMSSIFWSSTSAFFMLAAIVGGAQEIHHLQPGFNVFSKQQDVQLGEETAAKVRKEKTVIKNPMLTDYVNRVGKRLAASQEARNSGFPFTFEVVADPTINAFALPGGHMFIHTGLLKALDNEAQLAGVMGHEMSHVILRHGTNQATKAKMIELPAALAEQVAGKDSMMGKLEQLGIGLGANSVLLKFSREAESQADLTGSHIMAESGYNPIEMAHFFNKLTSPAKGLAGSVAQFMSDHPNPGDREKAIEKEAKALPSQKYGYETGDYRKMKSVVMKIREPKPVSQPQEQPPQRQQ